MTDYYKWDYDKEQVTQYERLGECNQCGQCCMAAIQCGLADGGKATNHEGVWFEVHNGKQTYYQNQVIKVPGSSLCPALTAGGLCSVHQDKHSICEDWPWSPDCIELFPECSFSFVNVGNWSFDELEE